MMEFTPLSGANYKHDYTDVFKYIANSKIQALPTYRELCKDDLFFLLYFGLNRPDVNHPFIVDAIREVEAEHEDTLDLWAREHFKSTILSYGLPLQDLIKNPEERICIFSHTRPIAKGFLRQIKVTLESNVLLKRWFPDVFWPIPKRQAPKWSEDDGLVVKRKTTPKESSIEAWGLVDGQPTSKHFTIRIYDDVVTEDSVTDTMIKKTGKAFELSHSLGTDGGVKRVCGTHYHFADLYMNLRARAESFFFHGLRDPEREHVKHGYKVRLKPATHNGEAHGRPVLLSENRLAELKRDQTSYIFSCQQLLNPVATEDQVFKLSWLRFYEKLPNLRNKYILMDSADEQKEENDFTVIAMVSLDEYNNRFLEALIRDKLKLRERWKALRDLWQKNPDAQGVWLEKYGKDSDGQYYEQMQEQEGIFFPIWPIGGKGVGAKVGKIDRIKRLQPVAEQQRFYIPRILPYKERDMIHEFINDEWITFPFSVHDDILDCISRIEDPQVLAVAPIPPATMKEAQAPIDFGDISQYPGYGGFIGE